MKEIRCFYDNLTIDGIGYELICIPDEDRVESCYTFYLQPADHTYTLREMFGLPSEQFTLEEAFEIARDNVPNYISEFC